jgi:hypothetical protein
MWLGFVLCGDSVEVYVLIKRVLECRSDVVGVIMNTMGMIMIVTRMAMLIVAVT